MNSTQTEYDMLNVDSDILKKAWDGDAVAQLILGKAYFSAVFNKDNCANAFKWLFQSAEQGNMEAQFRLGDLYALGQGTQKSLKGAYLWYTRAALQGYKKALIRIHNLYQEDKKMYCRGQINSDEEEWASDEFKKKNNIRELNEYRREQQASILNNAVDYYTDQFKFYKASDSDDLEVQLNLAFSYQHGYGVKKYTLRAIEFYTKAADHDHRDAQYNLGYLYQHNTDIKFNYRHALRWYRVSATKGNIAAQNCLGYFYENGLGTELNYDGALYWYTKGAECGHSSAQLNVGRLYRKGQGVEQDLLEAAKWYKLASNQGNAVAQNCISRLYHSGDFDTGTITEYSIGLSVEGRLCSRLQKDIDKLTDNPQFNMLKRLAYRALRADINAMYRIGLKYYNGEDLPFDKHIGFYWIKKSAKGGLEDAQLMIAKIHEKGDILGQDFCESSKWYMKSVKKSNDKAQLNLGLLYKQGFGVRKDALEASKWFLKSSRLGNNDARYQLGLLKYHGEGVRKNYETAHQWFLVAALNGNIDAICEIAKLVEEVGKFGFFIGSVEVEGSKIITTNWGKRIFKLYNLLESREDPSAPMNSISKDIAPLIYKLAAKYENKDAQFRLGKIYEEGNQVEQDQEKAHEYYVMASNSGDPFYQTELAIKYLNGCFRIKDYNEAFDLLKKAAGKNEPRAAGVFETPMKWTNSIKDSSKVIDMFTSASSRGIEGIDYNLGFVYEYGIFFKEKNIFEINYPESKLCYSKAAEKGDSRAQYRLGVMYEEGKGVGKDIQNAITHYSQAYENGNCDAAYSLGLMYLNGKGVSQDLIKSFYLFSEASEMGYNNSYKMLTPSYEENILPMLEAVAKLGYVAIQYHLGVFYDNKDDLKSFKWLTSAIQGRISDAYYRLGVLYEEGRGTSKDYSKAIEFYSQAVSEDHEDAMYRLAQIYQYGVGTKLDYKRAYKLYTRASELGHCLSLKVLNITGDRKSKTSSKTREKLLGSNFGNKNMHVSFPSTSDEFNYSILMYRYIAEQGDTEAQCTLGIAYENAFSTPNYREAVKWYIMAANKSHGGAMYRLGLLYEQGLGVVQDYQEAYQLYEDASKQGNSDALYKLAVAYHSGTGVNTDLDKAIQYYTEAANYGHVDAQYNLGILYEQGELVERNILLALKWYTTAYLQGNDEVGPDLYNTLGCLPFEEFFYARLYKILSSLLFYWNRYKYKLDDDIYGPMYYRLGWLYLYGLGTQKNYKKAWECIITPIKKLKFKDKHHLLELDSIEKIEMLTEAADNGDEDAQHNVGKYHFIQATKKRINTQGGEKSTINNDTTQFNDDSAVLYHYKKAIHYFSLSASKGHRESQFYLGKAYQNGLGTAVDYEQAKAWYIESSERQYREARYSLGMLYLNESVIEKHYPEALLNLGKAAQEGSENSSFQLGWMYEHGIGVVKDEQEAYAHFQNSINAMQNTNDTYRTIENSIYLSESTVGQEDNQNLDIHYANDLDSISITGLKQFSDKGNGEASYLLYQKYLDGLDIEKDHSKAMNYLRKAAYQGHTLSQEELALSYFNGTNVVKDIRMAIMWFRAGEKKHNKRSMLYLAQIYHCGFLGKHDFANAIKLYRSINGMHRAVSLQETGLLYEYGDGYKINYQMAFRFYNESFRKGNTLSGYNIALMYFYGIGVSQDYKESIHWLKKALEEPTLSLKKLSYVFIKTTNDLEVIEESRSNREYFLITYYEFVGEINYLLGRIYYNGFGVQQDTDTSFKYFSTSYKNGKGEAQVQLEEIEETRQHLQRIEEEKKTIRESKLQLEETIKEAEKQLRGIQEAEGEFKKLEHSEIQSDKIEKAKSLPKEDIKKKIKPLQKEIDKAKSLLDDFTELRPRPKKEFDEAKSILKKIIEEVKPQLKTIQEATSVLKSIEESKSQWNKMISEARMQLDIAEETKLLPQIKIKHLKSGFEKCFSEGNLLMKEVGEAESLLEKIGCANSSMEKIIEQLTGDKKDTN